MHPKLPVIPGQTVRIAERDQVAVNKAFQSLVTPDDSGLKDVFLKIFRQSAILQQQRPMGQLPTL
jgi:hypothetical protein